MAENQEEKQFKAEDEDDHNTDHSHSTSSLEVAENPLDTENEEVKSTAIVKYSVPKPAQFMKLQCNTDLNLPPSNWLSSSADSYGFQHILCHPKGFSSFRMAHMFPDCVGEVDVVSDAENIKNLLKIPYCKNNIISMIVHRIENTLLLDEFDIYRHLLKTSETEWKWLKKFFSEHINNETYEAERNLYIKSRRREALKQKSLVSKFLYHSLAPTDQGEGASASSRAASSLHVERPVLPEPSPSAEDPSFSSAFNHQFNRNVLWTFERIEMLLGTDLPIFGGGTHPCISLRLRDMNKPINVLTGIDYWLDNLMSNVPEVVMCYHLNGIVQKYELIKTEDLPSLDNSKFSPKLIRDVAQSILSFLKANATKAGHTYWLFKGKDEDAIKLYDLTSLCSERDVEGGQNPFTVPVAMLLYRVARNMKHSADRYQPSTIRMLLKNCVKLLPEEKYPEIVTSSHYMLSDLYVPANTNPESPAFNQMENDDTESLYDDDLGEEEDNEITPTKMLLLDSDGNFDKSRKHYKPPPPITGTLEERCFQAINHVATGLSCLKYFPEKQSSPANRMGEDEIKMAKPSEPIPMPYTQLSFENKETDKEVKESKKSSKKQRDKKKKADKEKENKNKDDSNINALLLKNKNEAQPLPTWQGNSNLDISWKDHLKTLLYEKAILVYVTLSEHYFVMKDYGSSLKTIGLLARCQLVMNELRYSSSSVRENCLLGRAGDCAIMMVQNWMQVETYKEQYLNYNQEDSKMLEQLENDEQLYNINIGETKMKYVFIYDILTVEQILINGMKCYEEALKVSSNDSILKRLGNCLNELASAYLNEAKNVKEKNATIELCKKSEPYLIRGLEIFEQIKDDANMALLYANMGHLHRLLAFAYGPAERRELNAEEKLHFNKAFINYKRAMQVLGDRKNNTKIWDAVNWELSTALYNMGCIMHEHPPSSMSTLEAGKEVIEILQKALQYCDLNEANPKFCLYQYRAAAIHYRIASLYHNQFYTIADNASSRKKIAIQLSKSHYIKAASLYFQSSDAVKYLRAQMERFALLENLSKLTNSSSLKLKHFQECLEIAIEMDDVVKQLAEKTIDVPEEELQSKKSASEDKGVVFYDNCYDLLVLVMNRLQDILKKLNQLCLQKPHPTKDCPKLLQLYRKCYQASFVLKDGMKYNDLVNALHSVLLQIKNEVKAYENEL